MIPHFSMDPSTCCPTNHPGPSCPSGTAKFPSDSIVPSVGADPFATFGLSVFLCLPTAAQVLLFAVLLLAVLLFAVLLSAVTAAAAAAVAAAAMAAAHLPCEPF